MGRVALLAPNDTHNAVADYGEHLRSDEFRDDIAAEDTVPTVALWSIALQYMRRDLDAPR